MVLAMPSAYSVCLHFLFVVVVGHDMDSCWCEVIIRGPWVWWVHCLAVCRQHYGAGFWVCATSAHPWHFSGASHYFLQTHHDAPKSLHAKTLPCRCSTYPTIHSTPGLCIIVKPIFMVPQCILEVTHNMLHSDRMAPWMLFGFDLYAFCLLGMVRVVRWKLA